MSVHIYGDNLNKLKTKVVLDIIKSFVTGWLVAFLLFASHFESTYGDYFSFAMELKTLLSHSASNPIALFLAFLLMIMYLWGAVFWIEAFVMVILNIKHLIYFNLDTDKLCENILNPKKGARWRKWSRQSVQNLCMYALGYFVLTLFLTKQGMDFGMLFRFKAFAPPFFLSMAFLIAYLVLHIWTWSIARYLRKELQ